jgi:hypothetical protein
MTSTQRKKGRRRDQVYYRAHRDAVRLRHAAYYKAHREARLAYQEAWMQRVHRPTYNSWTSAKRRCHDRNLASYRFYGGRKPNPVRMCRRYRARGGYHAWLEDTGPATQGPNHSPHQGQRALPLWPLQEVARQRLVGQLPPGDVERADAQLELQRPTRRTSSPGGGAVPAPG